jgi:hypothetical protein
MARNRELTLRALSVLAAALDLDRDLLPADAMLGSMVALPLPTSGPLAASGAGSSPLDTDPLQARLVADHRIEVPIYRWPVPAAESPAANRRLVRVSSALHNGPDDVDRLAAAFGALRS